MLTLNFLLFLLIHLCREIIAHDCAAFFKAYNKARTLQNQQVFSDNSLRTNGIIMADGDIGYSKSKGPRSSFEAFLFTESRKAEIFTETARLLADKNSSDLSSFEKNAICLHRQNTPKTQHAKYRSITGYGNNLKHPHWGAIGTPFARFGPKTYDDDIHSIRKSVTGSDLPSPRRIVQEVLLKAEKTSAPRESPNMLVNFLRLYLTHDMAHQVPKENADNREKIRCCTHGNRKTLSPELSHSACLPINIANDDPFYKDANIKCLNMIRSELVSSPTHVEYGEILNGDTSFLDHSIVYGNDDASAKRIRTYAKGELNMGKKNFLPVDGHDKYLESSERLTGVPLGTLWPVLFSRNHNQIAHGLVSMNPYWNDEKIFQEARRINIAIFQSLMLSGEIIEIVFKGPINETYNPEIDPSTTVEFTTAAYRLLHFYVQSDMLMIDKDKAVKKVPISDMLKRLDLVEDFFDDVLRGALSQPLNFKQYSDELHGKVGKNKKGFGSDLLSLDIQRGRDHGLPTFLDARRKCGFEAKFSSFDDLNQIFPKKNVELLRATYDSVEDIDLVVGGVLETFTTFDTVLAGDTIGCIIADQYRHTIAGDAYYFSHKTNPYPFTDNQLRAISDFTFQQLICKNSNIEFVQKTWFLVETPNNPSVACEALNYFDLSAWKA